MVLKNDPKPQQKIPIFVTPEDFTVLGQARKFATAASNVLDISPKVCGQQMLSQPRLTGQDQRAIVDQVEELATGQSELVN